MGRSARFLGCPARGHPGCLCGKCRVRQRRLLRATFALCCNGSAVRLVAPTACPPNGPHRLPAETEPWRQQLLNAAFCVGCSILGAATAVLIIRRTQSPA